MGELKVFFCPALVTKWMISFPFPSTALNHLPILRKATLIQQKKKTKKKHWFNKGQEWLKMDTIQKDRK